MHHLLDAQRPLNNNVNRVSRRPLGMVKQQLAHGVLSSLYSVASQLQFSSEGAESSTSLIVRLPFAHEERTENFGDHPLDNTFYCYCAGRPINIRSTQCARSHCGIDYRRFMVGQ